MSEDTRGIGVLMIGGRLVGEYSCVFEACKEEQKNAAKPAAIVAVQKIRVAILGFAKSKN